MRPIRSILLLAPGLLCLAFSPRVSAAGSGSAAADLQVQDPWVRWLPAGLPAAGYLTLLNLSDTDRYLTGAASPDYAAVMLHESDTAPNGEMGMRHVDKVRIPAHGEVRLAPGGYHLMLMKARHAIAPGDTVTVDLKFEDGRSLQVTLPVKPAGHRE